MTPEQAIRTIQGRCGARGASNQFRSYCILELNNAQEFLEKGPVFPFFLEATGSAALSTSPNKYALPSDFVCEVEDRPVYLQDSESNNYFLEKRFGDELVVKKDEAGRPKYYFISEGSYVNVYPYLSDPTSSTFNFTYFASQPQIDVSTLSAIDFKWYKHAPFMLIGHAGMIIARQYLKDEELAQAFSQTFGQAYNQIIAQNVEYEQRMLDLSRQKLR